MQKAEEAEREKIRAERVKLEEGGHVRSKRRWWSKKVKVAPVTDDGVFEVDHEVLGIVQSAIDGSEDATATLSAGPGSAKYKSEIRSEVPTIMSVSSERISSRLKRPASREFALKTLRALLWNPPAVLPSLPGVLLLLEEKLMSEPSGPARDLCMELCKTGPGREAAAELVLPMLLAHIGSAAAVKWKVKIGVMQKVKDVLRDLGRPEACPKQLRLQMPNTMSALRDATGDARKDVRQEAEQLLLHMGEHIAINQEIHGMSGDILASMLDSANMEKAAHALQRMANTTFMNTVDSRFFGLVFTMVSRATREQALESKMTGAPSVRPCT